MSYADDLILLAESEHDLQKQMNSLGHYANIFQMEVNQKKTKVLIFDSVANSVRDEFSLDLTESEEKLKNKIKSTYSKRLYKNWPIV